MAYTVLNFQIFNAAFSGALAGMITSQKVLSSASGSSYTARVNAAGAFAEAFDTAWGGVAPTDYQVRAAQELSAAAWEGRTPPSTAAAALLATYTTQATAIIAVITAGNTFLTAQGIPSSSNALTQPAWFLAGTTGLDTNTGLTSGSPLKTWAELMRRLGSGLWAPTGGTCTITVLESTGATDALTINSDIMLATACTFKIVGTAAISRSGSFTAVTNINRATNTPWDVTDAAMVTTWTADLGKRIRNTTAGARLDSIAWPVKDMGALQARMTVPNLYTTGVAAAKAFVNGDTYQVETLTDITVNRISPSVQTAIGTEPTFNIYDCNLASTSSAFRTQISGSYVFNAFNCQWAATTDIAGTSSFSPVAFFNCLVNAKPVRTFTTVVFFAGGILTANLTTLANASAPGNYVLDNDVICQNSSITASIGGSVQISAAAVFDKTGPGAIVANGGTFLMRAFTGLVTAALWGAGNSTVGLSVGAGSKFIYASAAIAGLTITGTAGNFLLEAAATARAFDEVAAIYSAVPIACTWVLLATTVAGGGFGGSAHNLSADAHIDGGA